MTLTRKDIDALPDDPRLFLRRLLEMAGATGVRGDVAIYVDGFRNYKRLPPKSVISQIRINSNPFSAEFSQQSAKRIEIATTPGSDGFHGAGTVQGRSNRLNARSPLADDKPRGQYSNVNGYLQGPLRKDRIGFLAYAGQWRQDDNATVHALTVDPAGHTTLPFTATIQTPAIVTSAELKFDARLFNQLLNVSYGRTTNSHQRQGLDSGFDLPEHAYEQQSTDDVGRLWWTIPGRRSLNDFRVEVSRGSASRTAVSDSPAVLVLDAFNGGGNQNAASRSDASAIQTSETFTLVRGRHTVKTGLQLETVAQDSVDRTGFGGSFTFGADVERDALGRPLVDAAGQSIPIAPIETYRRTLAGLAGYGPSQFVESSGDPQVDVTQWNAGWFVLDDWSRSKSVSVSYGLRAELQNNIDLRVKLAPRASVSWLLDSKKANVLKLGAGVFYTRVDPDLTLETHKLDGQRRTQIIVPQPAFFAILPTSLETGAATRSAAYRMADTVRMPSTFITTTTYERTLAHGLFVAAQYLFGRGFDQLRLRNTTAPGEPTSAPMFQFESTGRSIQHELMLIGRGGLGAKLSFTSNYRLGRKMSDTDTAYTLPARSGDLTTEYGAAATDRRHQITTGLTLELPAGIYVSPEVTFASGRPFNITTGRDNDGDTVFTDRPGFAQPGDPGAVVTPYGVFNTNPAPGDAIIPRNFGREPWQTTVDLTVSRTFDRGLTITAFTENLFNSRRYFAMNGVVTSPVFGLPNQALSARRFDLTIRYGF